MILGRGTAKTYDAITAEYHQFLRDTGQLTPVISKRLSEAPLVIKSRIGKSFSKWTDEDIISLYKDRQKATRYVYSAFLAFLIFRGYQRPTFHLLTTLPLYLCRQHRSALLHHRERIVKLQEELHYAHDSVASELLMLIWLLAVMAKPIDELTRTDVEVFRKEYNAWCQQAGNSRHAWRLHNLYRVERYLVHLGIIPEAKTVFQHEKHFARLRHGSIRKAILTHMQWCDVKYKPSSIHSRRAAVLGFFLWFQSHYPERSRLDDVTRPIALEYGQHLQGKVSDGTYSPKYRNDLYRGMRLFFDFVIDERLNTSPDRNPFARGDMPSDPDPVPRYISDHELRAVLEYCDNGATLKERTVVITLLHTGIRAAELATLQVGDIVQIQAKWKLHIHEGKGLKDRVIPLTTQCLAALQAWQQSGWERANDFLFTHHGKCYTSCNFVCDLIRKLGFRLGIEGLTPHRFRHTFAVALLNYGIRESALQKLMGHKTLNMTLEYGRILDRTVERAFNEAVERMHTGPLSWVPSFFAPEDYTLLTEDDALNWIRLPHGYCRRHPKLHCESDVKCLLCDRFCALSSDLPRLQEMHDRFLQLGMENKAHVVGSRIRLLESGADLPALQPVRPQYSQLFDQRYFSDETVLTAPGPQRKEG